MREKIYKRFSRHQVLCRNCGREGPEKETEAAAVVEWNKSMETHR
jgi:hypothetical protein